MIINGVKLNDADDYTCSGTRTDGSTETIVVQLDVRQNENDREREPVTAKIVDGEKEILNGRSFNIQCRTTGASRVEWLFNNNIIVANGDFDPQNEILNVRRFTESLSGTYTCRAFNSNGDSAVSTVRLHASKENVEQPLPSIRIDEVRAEGSERELACRTNGVRFEWLFNNQAVASFPNLQQKNELLVITKLNLESFGKYTCRSYNNAGKSIEASIELHGIRPFSVDVNPRSSNLHVGDDAEFSCIVTNQDQANLQIEWDKDGQQLPENAYKSEYGLLTLKNLNTDNSGVYTCTVTHQRSGISNSSSASLMVTANEPLKVKIEAASNGKFIVGRSGELNCIVSGGGKSNKITWSKYGEEKLDDRFTVRGSVLHISEVNNDDRGYFQCKVEDGSQTSVSYVLVDVEEIIRPAIDIYPAGDQRLKKGDSMYIQCRILAGEPSPSLEWRRLDGASFSPRVSLINDGAVLSIQNIDSSDFGSYECVATNTGGAASITISLIEEVEQTFVPNVDNSNQDNDADDDVSSSETESNLSPQIPVTTTEAVTVTVQSSDRIRVEISPKEQVVAADGNLEFSCNVVNANNNEILYQWSKPSGKLPANHQVVSNVLKINNAQPEDAGRYVCTVSIGVSSYYDVAYLEVSQNDPKSAFPLYVKVLEKPQISEQNPTGAFRIGNKLTLECYVRGLTLAAAPTWRKENGALRSNYIKNEQGRTSTTLTIPAVIPIDFGKYICEAKGYSVDGTAITGQNEITIQREQQNQFSYVIHGPKEVSSKPTQTSPQVENNGDDEPLSAPEVKIRNDRTTAVNSGQSLSLICDVKGNPKPEITWEKNGDSLPQGHETSDNLLK